MKNIDKKIFKKSQGQCVICGQNDYNLLDVHRIKAGKDGGKYTKDNSVTLCCECHRKVHSEYFNIKGYRNSTGGRLLEVEEEGETKFIDC